MKFPELTIDVNGIQTVTYGDLNLSKVCSRIIVEQTSEWAKGGFAEATMTMFVRTVPKGHVRVIDPGPIKI